MSSFEQRRAALKAALNITDHASIVDMGAELTRRGVLHLTPRRPNTANPAATAYLEGPGPWPEFQNRGPQWEQWDKWYQYDRYHLPNGPTAAKPEPA